MQTSPERTWSNTTIKAIETYIDSLKDRMPILQERLTPRPHYAYGKAHGSDVEIFLTDSKGKKHTLLFEVEQYASGPLLSKVKAWAKRHSGQSRTTTVVISLVLPALRNRLVGEFSKDTHIKNMVFSAQFVLFPGSGDGKIPYDLETFITFWLAQRL